MVFDEQWFQTHQRAILWCINSNVIGKASRRALHIFGDRKITRIGPSYYISAGEGEGKFIGDFRCNDKYGLRMYRILYPIWLACHAWDWLACLFDVPVLNLGFDSLLVYPSSGTSGTACDGQLDYVGTLKMSSFSTTVNITSDGYGQRRASPSVTYDWIVGVQFENTSSVYWLARAMFLFNTAAIGSGMVVGSATISIYGKSKDTLCGDANVRVVSAAPASNSTLVAADFNYTCFGTAALADELSIAGANIAGYNDIALNDTGLAAIAMTGVSKFGTRLHWDANASFTGTYGSGKHTQFEAYFSDDASGTKDPKLTVEYSLVPTPVNTKWQQCLV